MIDIETRPTPDARDHVPNGLSAGQSPDWSRYAHLEIAPVATNPQPDGSTDCGLGAPATAEIWSIYAIEAGCGQAVLVHDADDEMSLIEALRRVVALSGVSLISYADETRRLQAVEIDEFADEVEGLILDEVAARHAEDGVLDWPDEDLAGHELSPLWDALVKASI